MRNRRKLVACWIGSALALTALRVEAEERAPNDPPDSSNSKAADASKLAVGRAREEPSVQDLADIADDAYIYAYPLMLMDATARVSTNVASPDNQHAPINQFARFESLPGPNFTEVVLPNVDTLYTAAFLDLSHEPVVLHVPDTHERYYSMPMLDAYSNVFAAPGKRTMGTSEFDVAIVGPNFKGDLPWGLRKIAAPTDRVWVLGRTQVNGQDDLPKVIELARQYSLTPLSSYGKPFTPPQNDYIDRKLDMTAPPPKLVASMGDRAYLELAALLLKEYPPPAADKPELAKLAKLGFRPGALTPSPAGEKALIGAGKRAMKRIQAQAMALGTVQNGWRVPTTVGTYGTNYAERAGIALHAFGANLAKDAIHSGAERDIEGQPLHGDHRYVIHFAKGQEPPVHAFWSLTMYDSAGHLVDNPIQRYAIASRDELKRNPDGSLDILVQTEAPQGEMAKKNWLPAPSGPFQLLMRLYWPQPSVSKRALGRASGETTSGQWELPAIERVKSQ